ncbi:hypothetical protein GGI20_006395, partial [Coemansia sp. BCRC 34301]
MIYSKLSSTFALAAAFVGCATGILDDSGSPATDINAIASLLSADFNDEIAEISSLWTDTDFMSSLSSVLSDNTALWASIQATIALANADGDMDMDMDTDADTDVDNDLATIDSTDATDTVATDTTDTTNIDTANTDTTDTVATDT